MNLSVKVKARMRLLALLSQNSAILTNSQKLSDLTDSLLLLLITDEL